MEYPVAFIDHWMESQPFAAAARLLQPDTSVTNHSEMRQQCLFTVHLMPLPQAFTLHSSRCFVQLLEFTDPISIENKRWT